MLAESQDISRVIVQEKEGLASSKKETQKYRNQKRLVKLVEYKVVIPGALIVRWWSESLNPTPNIKTFDVDWLIINIILPLKLRQD